MIEVQDIFRQYGDEYFRTHGTGNAQAKAFRDILNCRTSAMGGHTDTCGECGHQETSYNSCRNRHCPKCQSFAKELWVHRQEQNLLNVGYFHVVFTLPSEMNPVMFQNQETLYSLFFKAVSETLLELGWNHKYLGAKLGITAVLHTWGQNLMYHPHIHCIVPAGGLDNDGKWVYSRKKFLIPVKVLSKMFRGKFIAFLSQNFGHLKLSGPAEYLNAPGHFDSFVSEMYGKRWVTYCKPPFKNASKVIQYLGRYTHRVAISNNRIVELEGGNVTFKWRDYRDGNKNKSMSVPAVEFIRRFMLHILPPGFRKIRHYGILASKDKSARIALCKMLTDTPVVAAAPFDILEALMKIFGEDFNRCPVCGVGRLSRASPNALTA